jgi:hypothetical protein
MKKKEMQLKTEALKNSLLLEYYWQKSAVSTKNFEKQKLFLKNSEKRNDAQQFYMPN